MRIAVLVKQIPKFEEMELGADGRLRRDGIELEMNPYCRRAVAGRASSRRAAGASVTVFTLGPPAADDTLAKRSRGDWTRDVDITGVLVTDPAFAGSDTLATAQALAAAVTREGPFDLVLTGRNSVDADTGQVGPELAELLDLPSSPVCAPLDRRRPRRSRAASSTTDGCRPRSAPAILSTAERLIDPSKVDHPDAPRSPRRRSGRHCRRPRSGSVGAGRIPDVGRAGEGDGDRSRAGGAGPTHRSRAGRRRGGGARRRGARSTPPATGSAPPTVPTRGTRPVHGRGARTRPRPLRRELLGAAAPLTGNVLAVTLNATRRPGAARRLGRRRDRHLDGENVEEDVAHAVADVGTPRTPVVDPGAVDGLGPRGRITVAVRLGAGLIGDAVELDGEGDRLVAWKPAFGGQLVAAIGCTSACRWRPSAPACCRRSRRVLRRDRVRDDHAPTARARAECSPAPATTTSTCSPKRTPSSASAPGSAPTSTPRSNRSESRSAPSWARPARSPTRAGSPAPARSGSPAARSRPACSSASARAASSTTSSACAPRARCSRSTPTPTRRCWTTPTPASSATGTTRCRCSSRSSPRANA